MASRVKGAEAPAAPPIAPPAAEETEAFVPVKQVARVWLVVGRSSAAYGMRFTTGHPQMVADSELIKDFQNDGNFSVEVVPVTGGASARQR